MQVTETSAEGLRRVYAAKATAGEIDALVDAKINDVRPNAQLKGFRKGKVPQALLKKMFGKSMMSEAMQELVDTTLKSHFEETGHRPAGEPQIRMLNEEFGDGQDLDVEFSYELLPDIPEVSLGEIKLERLTAQIEETKVDEALGGLAKSAKEYAAKDGAAEDEDQVVIDFVGKIDGDPFEGGAAEDFPLTLGSGQFIPGFEPQLIGASAGDQRDVAVDFPADYGAENLKGKAAVFEVTVKEVRAPSEPAIDDALAQKFGAEDLEDLKSKIRERLAEEYRSATRALMKRKLLDELDARVAFALPESMVSSEARQIAHQLHQEEAAQKSAEDSEADEPAEDAEVGDHDSESDDPARESADRDDEQGAIEPNEEHRKLAERRVKLGLLLADIGASNKIELSDADVQNALMAQARQYPGQENEFLEYVRANPQIARTLTAPAFEDKVIDFVFELAQVDERSVTVEELKTAMEALDEEAA